MRMIEWCTTVLEFATFDDFLGKKRFQIDFHLGML